MTPDQLAGKYARLQHELQQACAEPVASASHIGLIDRIGAELLELERRLALLQAGSPASHASHAESSAPITMPPEAEAPPPRLAA